MQRRVCRMSGAHEPQADDRQRHRRGQVPVASSREHVAGDQHHGADDRQRGRAEPGRIITPVSSDSTTYAAVAVMEAQAVTSPRGAIEAGSRRAPWPAATVEAQVALDARHAREPLRDGTVSSDTRTGSGRRPQSHAQLLQHARRIWAVGVVVSALRRRPSMRRPITQRACRVRDRDVAARSILSAMQPEHDPQFGAPPATTRTAAGCRAPGRGSDGRIRRSAAGHV